MKCAICGATTFERLLLLRVISLPICDAHDMIFQMDEHIGEMAERIGAVESRERFYLSSVQGIALSGAGTVNALCNEICAQHAATGHAARELVKTWISEQIECEKAKKAEVEKELEKLE